VFSGGRPGRLRDQPHRYAPALRALDRAPAAALWARWRPVLRLGGACRPQGGSRSRRRPGGECVGAPSGEAFHARVPAGVEGGERALPDAGFAGALTRVRGPPSARIDTPLPSPQGGSGDAVLRPDGVPDSATSARRPCRDEPAGDGVLETTYS